MCRFETPCVPTRWTGEQWSRCPGAMARRARDSVLFCDEAQQVGCLRGRTVARKSSIGGFMFVRRGFAFVQGGLIFEFDKCFTSL